MCMVRVMTKEAIYARISTSDGRQDLETQLSRLRDRVEGEYEEYTDEISGADFDRPGLDSLIEDCQSGKIDKVYIAELSRLGRSLVNLENIIDKFEAWGVDLVILEMGMDTSTPAGRLFFQMAAAFAEYERELIRQRVKRGMERAREEGKEIGRPSKELSDEDLKDIHERREEDESWSDIAEDYDDISKSSLCRKYNDYMEDR